MPDEFHSMSFAGCIFLQRILRRLVVVAEIMGRHGLEDVGEHYNKKSHHECLQYNYLLEIIYQKTFKVPNQDFSSGDYMLIDPLCNHLQSMLFTQQLSFVQYWSKSS